ncbi:hypothetical protein QBC34DRAFT_219268 [Podospora aff. communis PSN243]|uniref:Uncharacterized protein n=1 Tax=Podospora aff. communis PSN243 TaxID=3040156 RepID=A0AAV9GZE6_9PEZI|nr:hypothetical protein QBC34DRAFT_219268 [Podospora aff. communis PSN243]
MASAGASASASGAVSASISGAVSAISAGASAAATAGGSASPIAASLLPLPTLTSAFIECIVPPSTAGPVVAHYTSYIVLFPAACATRQWMATYTVGEWCPTECDSYHRHRIGHPDFIPPNFVVTTVHCDVCAEKTQTITCPNALGTAEAVIHGDGVTATVVVTPTPEAEAPTLPVGGEAQPPNSLPNAPPAITYGGQGPAASISVVRVGGTPVYGGHTPLVTAGAPTMGLKTGLVLLTSLSLAAFNMFA